MRSGDLNIIYPEASDFGSNYRGVVLVSIRLSHRRVTFRANSSHALPADPSDPSLRTLDPLQAPDIQIETKASGGPVRPLLFLLSRCKEPVLSNKQTPHSAVRFRIREK